VCIKIIPLLFFFYVINAQIALPTFQAVHKPQTAEASSLYDFTTHTFTNCSATGREGPTLANCKSSYNVSWEDDTDLFNVQTQGVQEWTAPTTGTYTIEVWGASGTDSGNSGSGDGGRGVKMKGSFSLTNGQILKIIVGQVGLEGSYESGGGGGSYVYSDASDSYPLIVAGGGAGASHYGGKGGGGGGGSYNSGSNQYDSSTLGYNTSDGKVIITKN